MKTKAKSYALYENERPKVLLVGNGTCRAFGGKDWDDMLDSMLADSKDHSIRSCKYQMPMPLKAAMLTGNNVAAKMRSMVSKKDPDSKDAYRWESFASSNPKQRAYNRKLMLSGFDYILTTNYSYELELALLGLDSASPERIKKMLRFTEGSRPQTKFLLNTYNSIVVDGKERQIWHIHGEARKPDSMIIGHYFYGKLLSRIIDRVDRASESVRNNLQNKKPQPIGSWVDAFLYGDVYIVGFGLDFSESDIWWLIDHKYLHPHGKIVYFDDEPGAKDLCPLDRKIACEVPLSYVLNDDCKHELLKTSGVEVRTRALDISDPERYYEKVYEEICEEMQKAGGK